MMDNVKIYRRNQLQIKSIGRTQGSVILKILQLEEIGNKSASLRKSSRSDEVWSFDPWQNYLFQALLEMYTMYNFVTI